MFSSHQHQWAHRRPFLLASHDRWLPDQLTMDGASFSYAVSRRVPCEYPGLRVIYERRTEALPRSTLALLSNHPSQPNLLSPEARAMLRGLIIPRIPSWQGPRSTYSVATPLGEEEADHAALTGRGLETARDQMGGHAVLTRKVPEVGTEVGRQSSKDEERKLRQSSNLCYGAIAVLDT